MANISVERTLGEILATQKHIVGSLDAFTNRLESHIREDKEIEKRVDKIENKISYATGVTLTFVAFFSLASDLILTKLGLK